MGGFLILKSPPKGLGTTIKAIKRLCIDVNGKPLNRLLDKIDKVIKQAERPGERTDLVYNVHDVKSERPSGNSAQTAIRRLRKHRPDLHAQVLRGHLTPHGAMVEAGFRKKRISCYKTVEDVVSMVIVLEVSGGKMELWILRIL